MRAVRAILWGLFFAFSATCGPAKAAAGPRWLRLALEFEGADPELGHLERGVWRTMAGQYSGEGVSVRPDHPASLTIDIPPASVLRFQTTAYHEDKPPEAARELATLRIHLDGEEIFSTRQPSALMTRGRWHTLSLPAEGRRDATLEFSVEGLATRAAFLAPTLGPAEVGSYAARPWGRSRPNIILFLADTFRADNLSAYGGEHGRAPGLDRLLERSVSFLDVWSPAAWTLPSQASLMTGVYPQQHGAVRNRLPIDAELTTIAELLAEHGYRTGAVTDSGFVSAKFGFDQGFQWYEENSGRDFAYTLASASDFIAQDDGRPFFLFVQTYRTHDPYLTGPGEDQSGWDALMKSLAGSEDVDDALFGRADELRELYLAGVSGFDQLFGPWFETVEAADCLANGHFFFTSDHGEAFGEHEDIKHGGLLWEEKLRVPLFIHGVGLEPGQRSGAVSLVDFPATVADLAGLEAQPDWAGQSIFQEQASARSIFAFGEELTRYPPHLAMIERRRKVMMRQDEEALREARVERAFDLEQDPGELHDLAAAGLAWPEALCLRLTPEIELFSIPLAIPAEMVLERDMERQLRELGY
jgi:arylsulfatase A-like enzyme